MTRSEKSIDLAHRLAPGAEDAPAIAAPERAALSHGRLRRLIQETVARLNALGIGRGDRVAIVLPNGPEMATAFIAIAAAASTAPLNPAYRADELDFYLSDIGVKAILVGKDETGPAVDVAGRLGICVLRLVVPDGAPAGVFTIEGDSAGAPVVSGLAKDGDVALLL
ncbi:MAG: AMP-dependent synthetase, partial [Mesorhizobium sp.]